MKGVAIRRGTAETEIKTCQTLSRIVGLQAFAFLLGGALELLDLSSAAAAFLFLLTVAVVSVSTPSLLLVAVMALIGALGLEVPALACASSMFFSRYAF